MSDEEGGRLWSAGDEPPAANEQQGAGREPELSTDGLQTKVCPKCAVQSTTNGAFCPHCGARHGKRNTAKRTKAIAGIGAVIVVRGGAGGAIAMKVQHDDDVRAAAKAKQEAADRRAEAVAQERKREVDAAAARERVAKAKRDLEVAIRRDVVHGMEKSITKDAKSRVAEGYLDGPILGTQFLHLAARRLGTTMDDAPPEQHLTARGQSGAGRRRDAADMDIEIQMAPEGWASDGERLRPGAPPAGPGEASGTVGLAAPVVRR